MYVKIQEAHDRSRVDSELTQYIQIYAYIDIQITQILRDAATEVCVLSECTSTATWHCNIALQHHTATVHIHSVDIHVCGYNIYTSTDPARFDHRNNKLIGRAYIMFGNMACIDIYIDATDPAVQDHICTFLPHKAY
jgi:hypothetical protein